MSKLQLLAFAGAMSAAAIIWFFGFRFLFTSLYGIPIMLLEPNSIVAGSEAVSLFVIGGLSVLAGFWILTHITKFRGSTRSAILLIFLMSVAILAVAYFSTINLKPTDIPYEPTNPPNFMKTGSASSGNGPSVDATYECLNKTFHEVDDYFFFEENYTGGSKDYFYFSDAYTMMLANDTTAWNLHWRGTNATELDFDVYFHFPSPYEAVDNLYLTGRIRCYDTDTLSYFVGDACTLVIFITDSSGSDSATLSSVDVDASSWNVTTIALDADNVIDGYIHGRIAVDVRDNDATLDVLNIDLDYFAFDYTDVTETRRSSYSLQGGTLRYTIDWTVWDYNVNVSLGVPSDWTFKDVNPDCEQTSDEFACLVPEDYEAVYTCNVLATANWEEVQSWSFEADGNDFVTVLDGAASYDLGSAWKNLTYSTATESWVVWSCYGSVTLDYTASASVTAGTTGEWTTTLTHATTISYLNFTGTNCIIDGVTVYQSSVTTGSTISGTTHHVHPNGYTAAAFVPVRWRVESSGGQVETDSGNEDIVVTDANGDWSVSAPSLSTGTYLYYTYVANDANTGWFHDGSNTTGWTEQYCTATSDGDLLRVKDNEGSYSYYNFYDASVSINVNLYPFLEYDIHNVSGVAWLLRDGSTYVFRSKTTAGIHYANAKVAWSADTDGIITQLWTGAESSAENEHFTFDSITFYGHFTNDTLSYPFSLPSDWSLTGSFSFSDKYGHCFITTNYDASYTVYENDTSVGSGSVTADEDNIRWQLNTKKGYHVDVGVEFTITDCSGSKWVNTSYDNTGATPLYITDFGMERSGSSTTENEYVHIWVTTSWRNTTVTIKDYYGTTNTTKINGEAESTRGWSYEIPHQVGNHTVYIDIEGGADSLSRSFDYEWEWPLDIPGDYGTDPEDQKRKDADNFLKAVLIGVVVFLVFVVVVSVIVLYRKDRNIVWQDEEGRVLHKKKVRKIKVKKKRVSYHDAYKSEYESQGANHDEST